MRKSGMLRFLNRWTVCLLFTVMCFSSTALSARVAQQGNNFDIRLITYSPHDELFAWFGHSAIEVRKTEAETGYAFNFGGFTFDWEHFVQFAMGKFIFWSYVQETEQALIPYEREHRSMIFQTLDLTYDQKQEIRRLLFRAMEHENRFYVYEHFRDNCSTRIRDIIDKALGGALKEQTNESSGLSFRDYVHRMTYRFAALDFLMMFLLNDSLDTPVTYWESMFLPDRLMASLQSASNPMLAASGNHPLVKKVEERNAGQRTPFFDMRAEKANTWVREIIFGLVLFLIFLPFSLIYLRKQFRLAGVYPAMVSLLGLVFGFLGLLLFNMMCFTNHVDTYWNENILLLNPITFLLFPAGIIRLFNRGIKLFSWISLIAGASALLGFALKLLPAFDQANGQQLRVLLPTLLLIGITGLLETRGKESFKENQLLNNGL